MLVSEATSDRYSSGRATPGSRHPSHPLWATEAKTSVGDRAMMCLLFTGGLSALHGKFHEVLPSLDHWVPRTKSSIGMQCRREQVDAARRPGGLQ